MNPDPSAIIPFFQINGTLKNIERFGTGHIHDTYVAAFQDGLRQSRYTIQRVNHLVFKNPALVMDNIARITSHVLGKLSEAREEDRDRRSLALVPARDGSPFCRDEQGNYWRVFVFIEDSYTCDVIERSEQAFEAARTFGFFQKLVVDLPKPRLHETILDFHNTPKRLKAFQEAVRADVRNRAVTAKTEIDFILKNESVAGVLLNLHAHGKIPERITHNDTKVNNVLFCAKTQKGLCAIDLDTVMPGLALYDFGDMVRSMTSPAEEDERDLSKVRMQMPMFQAIARGYLSAAGEFLNRTEKEHLAFSGKLITFEQAVRFLTDYIEGDIYYKIHRQGHNLERARTQIKLVESIMENEDEMNHFVRTLL